MGSPLFRTKVEHFLGANGLRLEDVDAYCVIESPEGEILAGGGIRKDTLKCLAVAESARSEGLLAPIVSRLLEIGSDYPQRKVFTKPGNRAIFESLGFHLVASAPEAILLTDGKELDRYCQSLCQHSGQGRAGVIVMNANPFTRGHDYLFRKALEQVDRLFIIPVREDVSRFPYAERKAMIEAATGDDARVTVLDGSEWQISALTFPTYFLKDLSTAAETQMRLDIDLFARHIAPALGIAVRFVGSEPTDALTARYNALMQQQLPERGIEVVEIPRLTEGEPVSASRVRAALDEGSFARAAALTPATTHPYLLADLAAQALRLELDTPFKPGLVGPDGPGAHSDMDYALMQRSIAALRPWFGRMAAWATLASGVDRSDKGVRQACRLHKTEEGGTQCTHSISTAEPLCPEVGAGSETLRQLGIDAEKAMLAATGGVNTHRGAIFALGQAIAAAVRDAQMADNQGNMQNTLRILAHGIFDNSLKNNNLGATAKTNEKASKERFGVKGAREMALEGYKDLFESWLPYYRNIKGEPFDRQRTLLLIMSTLDDTCVIKRAGAERAHIVKEEAKALLKEMPDQVGHDGHEAADLRREKGFRRQLTELCAKYATEGISCGGAADMLALTIFIDTITS